MESDRTIATSLPPPLPLAPPATLNGSNNVFPRVRPMHGRTSGPTRRSTRGQWTLEEDEILRKAVQRFKGKNWKKIAESFKDRTDVQCLHRWQKVLNPELIKGPWSKEEDEIIVQLVNKYGPKKWSTIAQHLPGRIGKQCRERWHNHLNPKINKEAWTQEEELVLIRAHQIHGNRWAELTKYLPGRTDNAIKNHWNSSVKKKLDSYVASGILAQFQGLPLVSHQSQPMVVQQSSGDGSVFRDGSAEAEQNSECSQVGCSQTASDMSNTAGQVNEDFLLSEQSDHGKFQSTSPTASCSEQYYNSVEDITFTIPDIPYEYNCSSKFLDENFSSDCGPYEAGNSSFGAISLPDIPSMELGQDTNFSGNYYIVDPINDLVPGPSNHSIEYDAFASVNNVTMISDASGQNQKTKEGYSELILQNKGSDGCPVNDTFCSDIIDMDRFRDFISFQTIYQLSDASGDIALPSNNPLEALVETSNCENQINDSVPLSDVQDISNVGSPCNNHIDVELTEQTEMKEPSRLVPVNTFGSGTSRNCQTHSDVTERPVNAMCEQEAGTLCYEPPRFPYLDIPFFSCDLAHSGNDGQQEFSPLGIRQLMMSSKLWDSPSSEDSPDAVLKSAAKTFPCTPSILKKRHRDLLSPLSPFSDRRFEKKVGSNVKQGPLCTSKLTTEFSRLDVMFDEAIDCKDPASPSGDQNNCASIGDKENICPAPERQREVAQHDQTDLGDRVLEESEKGSKDLKEGNLSEKSVHEEDCASETAKGALVERLLGDEQFASPDRARQKARSETGDKAIEVWSLKNTSKLVAKAKSILSPSFLAQKKQINDSAVTSVMVDGLVNEVGVENLNFFGGTPFRRSIESPSAWKSPWYFSSLVNCPRFDSDLTIEDIGVFMSPGERSFDAIGLMKQINEQSADAYADAREVLGSETPESILTQRCFGNRNLEGESSKFVDNLVSNGTTEARVLDFSECELPAKPTENGKAVMAASLASPSSSLLKSYR